MMTRVVVPLLTRTLRAARRVIPSPIRNGLRHWMFMWLGLTWRTNSGIRVRIERYADWIIYNEIFVNGDYDHGIALALDYARGDRLHVVDLGANVGYFTLRAFDRLLERGMERESMTVTGVEGDSLRAAEYESRVFEENDLRSRVQLIRGLVGRRAGVGKLCTDSATAAHDTEYVQMPYVDLSPLLESESRIALIKCDIEGAEESLIESYPELFAKTQVAIFEFHAKRCNVDRCRTLLRDYGFTHVATRRPETDYSVCTFWR